MAFDVEEYAKKRRQNNTDNNNKGSESKASFDVEEYVKQRNLPEVAKDLNMRVDAWRRINDYFFNNYNSRIGNKGDDPLEWSYESDSKDWLNQITTKRSELDNGAEDILAILNSYGSYFNEDYVDSITKALSGNREKYDDIIKGAEANYNYWSQWKTEDEYKESISEQNKYNAKLNYDLEAGKSWLDELEKDIEKLESLATVNGNLEYNAYASELAYKYGFATKPKESSALANQPSGSLTDDATHTYINTVSPQQLKGLLSEKKAYYTLAERAQNGAKLDSIASASDPESENYDPKSENYDSEFGKYVEQGNSISYKDAGNSTKDNNGLVIYDNVKAATVAMNEHWLGKELFTEDMITPKSGILGYLEGLTGLSEYNTENIEKVNVFRKMNEAEFSTFAYYLAKDKEEGTNLAEQYVDYIEESLNHRLAKDIKEAKDNIASQYVFGAYAGLDQWFEGRDALFSNEDYIPISPTQFASGMIREDLANTGATLPDWLGGDSVGQVGYDFINTSANMLPTILASTAANAVVPGSGKVIGAVAMGVSAAGNGKAEMLRLGYSMEQATSYGLMVGAAEASMEVVLGSIPGISNGDGIFSTLAGKAATKIDNAISRVAIKLGNKGTSILRAVANGSLKIAGGMGDEALEEGLQTVIEPWLKEIATDVDWDDPNLDEILYSSLLGALTSVALGGIGDVAGEANTYKAGRTIQKINYGVSKLQEIGTAFSADTVAYKIASEVNSQTDAYTIGRLLSEVGGTISEQNYNDIVNGLVERGIRKSDAKKIAREYQKDLNNEMMLPDEIVKEMYKSLSPLADVLRKNIIGANTTVYQRTRAYSDLMNLADEVANGKKGKKGATTETSSVTISEETKAEYERIASEVASGKMTSASERAVKEISDSAKDSANTAAKRLGVEGLYTSTNTGKTWLNSSRRFPIQRSEVNIVGVDSTEGGLMKLKLDDGSVVDADEIDFRTSDEALVYEAVANMGVSANTAWEILKAYDPKSGQSGTVYAMGALEAYTYGHNGVKVDGMSTDGFSSLLSPVQKNTANRLGEIDAKAKKDAEQKAVDDKQKVIDKAVKKVRDEAKSKHKAIEKRKGGVIFEGKHSKLKEHQQRQLEVLEKVAEGLGVTFHIFESDKHLRYTMPDGTVKSTNGWYNPKTGEIWIDLKAGDDGKGTIIFTAAHELTHFIKQWSPAKFKVFADFLMEQYGKHGQDVNQLVIQQMKKAAGNNRIITWDEAYEEVVADSCETFLRDSKAAEKIAALREKDVGLANKIKTILGQMLAKMRKVMADLGLKPDTKEGKMVAEMTDSLEKLYNLWTDALADAGTAYSTLADINLDTESVAPMLSERTWTASEYVTEREETAKKIAKTLGVDIETAYKYIDDINSVARLIADDRARLDYEPNLDEHATVLKPNSDYKYSVDMSTLCAKRLLFTGTFDAIQRALPNTVFDSEDIVALREMMQKRGYEVACGICYVESTRREIGRITQDFINSYKESQKTGKPITRTNSEGKVIDLKKTNDEKASTADKSTDKFFAEKDYTPTLADLNTTDIDLVKRDHPLVYEAYLNFMNARGQAKPKLLETRAEYKGEILKHFKYKSAVTSRNNAGGLRLQSFSDFEVPHLIDMMQIVMDMSRVGLKSQAYTKVPAFAEVFGDTGVKINLSLIAKGDGLDANGNLIFDDVEGINHKEAFKLRDKYSKNVGTILVGKTDAHIIAAMADSRIDYIIPFHKSSWKESLYDALGLTGYADYTETQHEKAIDKSRKISDYDPSEYWDFSKTGDENAQIYLQKCREDGRIPKFPQFQGYPGYWKLLIDFKMYDNDGVGSPQEVVRPTFNTEASERILSEYKGGHKSFPVAKDVVEDFVKEHKDNGAKYSLRNIEPIETADYVKMYHHFGSTKNYDVAGYILGNGVMLDFSGKHWGDDYSTSRQVDHRDIQEVLGNRGSNNGVNAMIDMIGNGNIRLMPEVGGINLAVMPNATQMSQLRGYINHFKGEVSIDIDEVGGDTIHSFSYTRGTSSAKVLADIKAYFDEGVVPKQKDEGETDIHQFLYSDRVADKKTVNFLDEQLERGEYDPKTNPNGGYYVTYKSMSFWGYDEDGNAILRSPMAEYVDGKLSGAYLIPKDKNKHIWYQATESIDENTGLPSGLLVKVKAPGKKNPNKLTDQYLPASENRHLIKDDWSNLYFNLKKKIFKNGKWEDSDVPARYNPYEHSSNSMLNDQFAVAYLRDNLVTVKMYVPVSEDNGTYRATWSKDPTGWTDWKTGVVAGKIGQQKDLKRRLYLSRYATPVEIVPDSEVAQAYKGYLEGTDVAIPDNVVPPNLLKELKKIGVPIEESGKVMYSDRTEGEKLEERDYTVSEIKDIFNKWNSDKELASLAEKVFEKLESFIADQVERGNKERHYMFQYAERPYTIKVTNADYIRKRAWVNRGVGVFSDDRGSGLYGITFDSEGLAALDNDQTRAQVLLHEAIHAITVRAIDKVKKEIPKDTPLYTDFVAPSNWTEEQKGALALLQIFQQVGFSGYLEKKVHYGEETVYEMVAELSNPEFRQFLKKKSLWSRVVDAIKRILGLEVYNAFDATSSALEKILNDGVTTSDSAVRYSDRVLMGSLFSGGGTLEAGLVYQMLDKEFAVEYNKKIASTYTDNHGKEHMFVGDVRDFNSKDKQNVFYLHASPVCKNFSPASHKGGETTLDITTAQATAKVLEEQMPQVFTVENVKRYIGSEAYNIIINKLNELGYTWDVAVYRASDYGNATKRERMIIRAVKDGQLPERPQKASNITSWGEATRDLWETDLIPSYLVQSKIAAINNTPQLKGIDLKKLDKPLMIYDTTKSKTAIFAWADELAPTLTTKCGDARIIMPDGKVYAPTPKFMGRIQGLPDDYKYPKAVTNAFKIIGNGIPTQLTKAVMGGVLDSAYEQTHDGDVLYSDRSPSSVSTRSLLANALETTAQNDIERTKISQYKAKIALIEAEYAKLAEIKKQANDIRFTKGRTSAETKQMKALEFEANQIANRINVYDRQLFNLESTTALKNVLQREKELARRKEAKKGKETLAKQKEREAKTIRTLMDKNAESKKKAIDSRNRTEMRHKIRKIVEDLNNLLLNPTKDKHIPISLQKYVASALAVINMDTIGAEERIAKYNDLIAKAKDPDEIARLTKSRDNIELQGESLKDKLTTLQNAYAALLKSDDPLIQNAYDESIENLIENTIEKVGDTPIRSMSLEQLNAVYDMFKAIKATVRNANKMFKEGRQNTITANSELVKREVSAAGGHRNRVLKATKWLKKFGWNMLKPIYAMKLIGSDTLTGLYENVRKGEDTWAVDVNEARDFFLKTAKKYNYKSWDFKKPYTFKDSAGNSFSLSLEQIMSLYAYSKRNQADLHLEKGGFIFDDSIEVTESFKLGKISIPMKYEVNDANPHILKKDALDKVISTLDTDALRDVKGFVDEMQTYLSEVMGAKGNEVSLAMYDIKLYKEQNYFPLKTAKYFREFDPEKNGIPKIKNSGFSKNTVPQAGNPIILSNFMDVWANHVNDMSMYHAFVLPLEDFMRVYNYSTTKGGYDSVQQYIKNAYGSQANSYIENLMNDLNGGARTDPSADTISKRLSLYKKAKVFTSGSVIIQQPSAIARALAYIDPKYFVDKPVPSKHSETWAEVKKYAPVAIIKEMGYFDTNMGKSTVDFITSQEYDGIKEKFKAMFTDSNYRDEILSKAPALADELAWCAIWKAVKREVADSTNLQVGSEEFLKLAGKRFTEVVTKTQVYDSVLSRSALMRSRDTGVKMATAFMAEPTTSLNMVVDALIEGKRGNKKFAGRVVGAVAASIILNSILVSLVYAARDDDEDETYTEKYLESLTTEIIDGFNPLTYIPFVKDIWSIMLGFDIERNDMSLIVDLWQTVENLFSDNKSGFEKVEGVVGAFSALRGLPLANIMRDARAMYNLTETLLSGTPTTWAGVGDAVVGAFKSSIPLYNRIEKWVGADESKSDKLYDAIISGDQNQIERMKAQYKDEEAIESAIKQALRENDSRIKKAAKANSSGNIRDYSKYIDTIVAEGHFDAETVESAIRSEQSAFNTKINEAAEAKNNGEDEEYKKIVRELRDSYKGIYSQDEIVNLVTKAQKEQLETEDDDIEEVTSIYKASDVNSAFEGGNTDMALEVIDELINTKIANGDTEKEAKSSIRSSMTSYWKPLYKAAYKSGNTAEKERIERILKASGLYGSSSEVIKTCREWRTERD